MRLPLFVAAVAAVLQGVPFSQHGTVAQRVSYTNIQVEYNRPVARGRALFGGLVKWDAEWNPGADSATFMRLDKDVIFEGKPLRKGEYSLWFIPRASAPWTVIVSSASHVFHAPYPGSQHEVLRAEVMPEKGAHMEVMAFYFPIVARDSAVLRFHWGETMLPLRINVGREP